MAARIVRKHKITTLSSYLGLIDKLKKANVTAGNKADFLFRGQNSDKPLIPKIGRLTPKGLNVIKTESLLMKEFERQLPPFAPYSVGSDWDLLALAQHHGLPTRLLDWSYGSLTALFFCIQKKPSTDAKGKEQDGVVWLLKTEVADFKEDADESPYSKGQTQIFRPRVVSPRILAQAGMFTCHRPVTRVSTPSFVPLEDNPRFSKRLHKITVPAENFDSLRDELQASGINHLTVFPDLDGLACHLENLYFHRYR